MGLLVWFAGLFCFVEIVLGGAGKGEEIWRGGCATHGTDLTQAVKHSCALPSKHSLSYTSSTAAYARPGIEHRGAFVLRTYYFPSRYVLQVGYYDSSSVDG